MKHLHLMRHAKSSWGEPGLSDRERALNRRGQRDAPRMGRALCQRLKPMAVAVSPARRAQLTLEGLCATWPAMAELSHRTHEELYTFSYDELAAWMAGQPDSLDTLFLIGHNPAFTDLVNMLCGDYLLENLPTAGYVQLGLQIDHWCDLGQGCASLEHTLFPKQLNRD